MLKLWLFLVPDLRTASHFPAFMLASLFYSHCSAIRTVRALPKTHTYHSTHAPLRSRASRAVTFRVAASAAQDVKDLNAKFAIPGHVEFKEGRGGLPTVVLKHACGSSAEIALFGGCILSWKQASGDEILYVRPDAVFDKSKPISGGVPHCFPQVCIFVAISVILALPDMQTHLYNIHSPNLHSAAI